MSTLGLLKLQFCSDLHDDNQVSGSYRDLEEMLLEFGDMYVSLDEKTLFSEILGSHFGILEYSLVQMEHLLVKTMKPLHGFCRFLMLVAKLEVAMKIFSCAVQTVASVIHPCLNLLKNLFLM